MRINSTSAGVISRRWRLLSLLTVALLSFCYAVSVRSPTPSQTHEEIVDLLWTDEIRPLLLNRFPGLSEEQIRDAHAYAYGGAVIQDAGLLPVG